MQLAAEPPQPVEYPPLTGGLAEPGRDRFRAREEVAVRGPPLIVGRGGHTVSHYHAELRRHATKPFVFTCLAGDRIALLVKHTRHLLLSPIDARGRDIRLAVEVLFGLQPPPRPPGRSSLPSGGRETTFQVRMPLGSRLHDHVILIVHEHRDAGLPWTHITLSEYLLFDRLAILRRVVVAEAGRTPRQSFSDALAAPLGVSWPPPYLDDVRGLQ
jgi:hypothetical protein